MRINLLSKDTIAGLLWSIKGISWLLKTEKNGNRFSRFCDYISHGYSLISKLCNPLLQGGSSSLAEGPVIEVKDGSDYFALSKLSFY